MQETNRIDLKLFEHLGSGIPRILENYSKDCFKFSNNFIRISFPFTLEKKDEIDNKKGSAINKEKGGAIGGAIPKLTGRRTTVLQIIKSNNKISYRAIAEQMNINESAVLKHVEILKEKGYIERIGGTRGNWKVKI